MRLQTLAPRTNTTFSVVYLGRRAGHVAAHLYIHTSLGVYNYPVSLYYHYYSLFYCSQITYVLCMQVSRLIN